MKRKLITLFASALLTVSIASADAGEDLCIEYKINPTLKAKKQWQRIFKSDRKLKRLGIDQLPNNSKTILLEYLIDHSADSDNPTIPGA